MCPSMIVRHPKLVVRVLNGEGCRRNADRELAGIVVSLVCYGDSLVRSTMLHGLSKTFHVLTVAVIVNSRFACIELDDTDRNDIQRETDRECKQRDHEG